MRNKVKPDQRSGGKKEKNSSSGITGTYVYDKKLNKVIKISARIPKVSSKRAKEEPDFSESSPSSGEEGSGGTSASSGEEWNE